MTSLESKISAIGDIEFGFPSNEEIEARRLAEHQWTADNLVAESVIAGHNGETAIRFNCLSLPAWLEVARHAGVAMIPARQIATVSFDDFAGVQERRLESHDEHVRVYTAFEDKIFDELQPGEMVRMEQVAPAEVKHDMSGGAEMGDGLFWSDHFGRRILMLHEDRFWSTFNAMGVDTIRAFARPIIQARKIDGEFRGEAGRWPAEFRIYVEDGEIIGASNYYPQVDMDADTFSDHLRTAITSAQAMIDKMNEMQIGIGNYRYARDLPSEKQRTSGAPKAADDSWAYQDFTLDFLVSDSGEVLFLEGGPAGMLAAHPCCFLQEGRAVDEDFLKGVVFASNGPITPLAEFLDQGLTTPHPD